MRKDITPVEASGRTIKWSSSDTDVAAVSNKGVVTAVNSGSVTITASIQSVKDAPALTAVCDLNISVVPPKTIKLQNSLSIGVNEGKKLSVTFRPASSSRDLIWASSDESVATVDSKGRVTGAGTGQTTITAYSVAASQVASECVVTVKHIPPKSVTISPGSVAKIYPDKSKQLKATVLPAGCSNKEVVWKSSSDRIVTVDQNGVITAHEPGTATIRATTKIQGSDKKYRSASCKITVRPVMASELTVTPSSVNLSAGNTQQLSLKVSPDNVTVNIPVYTSSDKKIAMVSEDGLITAVRKGSATISVKVAGKTAVCKVNVKTDPPKGVILGFDTVTLLKGEETVLTHSVMPPTAAQDVSYSSSNPQVAEVAGDGRIKATGAGVCEIAVRTIAGNFEVLASIIVFDPEPADAVNEKITLQPGGSADLAALIRNDDTLTPVKDVWIWGSSVPDVAGVSPDGIVTAKNPGKTTVMAYTSGGDRVLFTVVVN
jgi:uncharacterized protein YjdB